MILRIIAVILFCLVGARITRAAEGRAYLNRFWQTSEGMPSNSVSDIAKDRDGFLWIATGAGVARFDGLRFQIFYPSDGLPDSQIYCLHVDQKNRVWVGTRRGVAYRENGVWIVPPGFSNEAVFALGEADDGAIWIGSYRGCWRWTEGRSEPVNLGGTTPDVRSFLSEGKSGMWILTQNKLRFWHAGDSGRLEEIPGPWMDKDLRDLARDNDGNVILCGTGVLVRRRNNEWEDLNPLVPEGVQNANLACAVAPDNTLWLATRNRGLVFIQGKETGYIDSSKDLSLNDVRSVLIDGDGMIWAGTNGGGINSLRRRVFDTYTAREGLGNTVTSALVITPNGGVIAGTDGGGIFRKEDGKFNPIYQNSGLPANGLIWSMCATRDNSLWVGTYRDGIFRIRDNHVERILFSEDISKHSIPALCETRDGGVLIGSHIAGIRKWKDGQFDPSINILISDDQSVVYDMLEDSKGRIWAATGNSGLWMFENGLWKEMTRSIGMPNLLTAVLHESPNGDLWVGSLGQGLARFRDGQWMGWSVGDGIVSDTICQILEDDSGYLWLGTDRGLQRVSTTAIDAYRHDGGLPIESMLFNRADGLPTPQFTGEHGNLSVRAGDGSLWFSLASGAIRVDPQQVSRSSILPVVRIESASADRGPIWSFEGPTARDKIILEPGAGTLKIRFSSPNFITPERGRFKYRMTGLENEWQIVEGTRVVSYAALPPGDYRFEVSASTSNGTWNPAATGVTILVQPFFWQTLGFKAALAAGVLTAGGFLIRTWSLRRLRRRLALVEQEHRVDKERARIARDLHDDLGASLSEINFLGTLTADLVTDKTVRSRVEGMVDRAQSMAKSLDQIVWTVNPANDSLTSTASYLCSRAQESLSTANIRCRLAVAENLPDISVNSELRHHLLMAVNEAIHNVMKHSRATECLLSIDIAQSMLLVTVADNGGGFAPEKDTTNRNGIENLKRRMEASAGSMDINSTSEGTTVSLRVPLP